MKIAVKDLEPNPYRKMDKYPIDRAKVEALKTSIKEKTFWDNILIRKHGKKYQLAYGHHRWIALKELGIEQIDVPVRDIADATMVQIMAEENLNWDTSPAVMTQTILVAKEFLEKAITDTPTLQRLEQTLRPLWADSIAFKDTKTKGFVGRKILVRFLGGNWTERKVQGALDIIKDKDLDQQAIKTIPTMEQAKVFRTSVKQHKISKPTQQKIAKTIVKEGVGKRDIPDLVAEHSRLPAKKEKALPKSRSWLDDFVKETCSLMNDLYNSLSKIKDNEENICSRQLREVFMRDGQELLKIMKGIFDEKEEEKKTKRVLSNTR